MRKPYLFVFWPALVGAALGAYAFVSPDTGVDGTGGALLALVGSVVVTCGAALALLPSLRRWALGPLNLLLALGALLTAVAAWFLMQTAFAVAMALACFGVLLALVVPDRRTAR